MNPAAAHYLEQCRALEQSGALPGRADWLREQRGAALARFEEVGFPTPRDEDWKYTNVKPITAKRFHAAGDSRAAKITPKQTQALRIDGLQSHRLVFVDGLFAAKLSDPLETNNGVTVASLARILDENPERIESMLGAIAPHQRHGFTALNHAGARDGAVILLEDNARPATLELLFVSAKENGFSQPRNLIIAGAGAKVNLIERHLSHLSHSSANARDTLTNSATEIRLGESAEVDYHLIQNQSAAAYQVCGVWAKQSRASRFSCRTVTVGGALVRNDLSVELAGEHAHCDLFGLYAATGAQHVDNHTNVTHAAADCTSCEVYKGVLDQRSRAVFHGRIVVAPGAQKTDATQTNNNLLLSRGAEIDTKPQLEIYADDVKCAHGATVGQLSADALFYLRARGVDAAEARRMLTFAFANEILGKIAIGELQNALADNLARRLNHDARR